MPTVNLRTHASFTRDTAAIHRHEHDFSLPLDEILLVPVTSEKDPGSPRVRVSIAMALRLSSGRQVVVRFLGVSFGNVDEDRRRFTDVPRRRVRLSTRRRGRACHVVEALILA